MPTSPSCAGTATVKGSSESTRMALLTASLVGIQSVITNNFPIYGRANLISRFTWGIEMTYCTPYLLNLGLTKSRVSLVWIAGPLSGLIMQPIVGILADRSTSKYGRRRPFMVVGTVIVSLCLLLLGFTSEFIAIFVEGEHKRRPMAIALAVLSIYGVDFAINAVQASTRSLIVDTLPVSRQQLGSAWASRMVAIGHLIGYAAGAMNLGRLFGNSIGDTQFKRLTVVAAVFLCVAVGLTCWAVEEKALVLSDKEEEKQKEEGAVDMLMKILTTALHLPSRINAICWIQFWSWIGWFPFLFYTTQFIGEIYLRYNAPAEARKHPDTLGQVGRIGSLSLVVFSIITFAGSVIIPWFVESPEQESPEFTPRPPASIGRFLLEAKKYKPTLLTAWTYSHVVFAASMIMAPFVTSLRAATAIVAMCGVPWALSCWAPFTFMGMEINRLSESHNSNGHAHPKDRDSLDLDSSHRSRLLEKEPQSANNEANLAGVYLGILNLYTTLPQLIGTFISWVVFSILEPGKSPELAKHAHPDEHHSTDGPNAIAVCLFIGALAALVASYETNKLRNLQQ